MYALMALGENFAGAEDGTVLLHDALHPVPQFGRRRAAVGVAQAVEPRHHLLAGISRTGRDASR